VIAPDVAAAQVITLRASDLPLRPGERLLPMADGACWVFVFALHEARYQPFADNWSRAQWIGDCRFGLTQGDGRMAGIVGKCKVDASKLYVRDMDRSEVDVTRSGQGGMS